MGHPSAAAHRLRCQPLAFLLLLLLLIAATTTQTTHAVRIPPHRRLRRYEGVALDGRTDGLVRQRRNRVLISAAQLQADMADGTPAERAAAPAPSTDAAAAGPDGGKDRSQGQGNAGLGSNNAMLGNTLTTDDPYAAAGLSLGKIPY